VPEAQGAPPAPVLPELVVEAPPAPVDVEVDVGSPPLPDAVVADWPPTPP
jgi:hypothetical protein